MLGQVGGGALRVGGSLRRIQSFISLQRVRSSTSRQGIEVCKHASSTSDECAQLHSRLFIVSGVYLPRSWLLLLDLPDQNHKHYLTTITTIHTYHNLTFSLLSPGENHRIKTSLSGYTNYITTPRLNSQSPGAIYFIKPCHSSSL